MAVLKIPAGPIMKNGKLTLKDISGKVVKIFVRTNKVPMKARVAVITEEFENIIDTRLENQYHTFYPFNDIARPTPENPFMDYFYVNGTLGLKVEGLESDEIITTFDIFLE